MTGGEMSQLMQAMLLGPWHSRGNQKMGNLLMKPNQQDLTLIKGLLEAGDVLPVIDRTFALAEVPDTIRYLKAGHAKGKVIITINQHPLA
jgi:NADPH:quinone reductase-like Zn-dependent oxidoreductase